MDLSKILRREVKRKIPRIVNFKNTVIGHKPYLLSESHIILIS